MTRSSVNLFTVLVGLLIVAWQTVLVTTKARGVSLTPNIASRNGEYFYFFMVLSVFASVLVCAILAFNLTFRRKPCGELVPWLLLGGLTLSGLSQILPIPDVRHVWWAAPIGLLLLFSIVRSVSSLSRPTNNPLILPLVVTAVMATLSGSAHLGKERVRGQPGTVVEGMLVSKAQFDQISQDTYFLREHLQGNRAVSYLVDDGDLSVLDGHFRSVDPYFVDWGGSPSAESRPVKADSIVVQTTGLRETKLSDLAASNRYEVVARNPRLAVLRRVDTRSHGETTSKERNR